MSSYFGIPSEDVDRLVPQEVRILMIHMLKWARYDLQKSPDWKYYRSAKEWVHGTSSEYVFSFPNVCDLLGIDQERTRQALYEGKRYVYGNSNKPLYVTTIKEKMKSEKV